MKTDKERLQGLINAHFAQMEIELEVFEQTTHELLGPFSIESVVEALRTAYKNPSPYTISTLSQNIHGFLKKEV